MTILVGSRVEYSVQSMNFLVGPGTVVKTYKKTCHVKWDKREQVDTQILFTDLILIAA